MRRKYEYIQVDEDCVQCMANTSKKTLPHAANTVLDAPVAMEEIHLSIRSRKPHKAPGGDGICQEFYKLTWETTKHDILLVLNQMHSNGKIMEQQKHVILVCLPKTPTPSRPEDYEPLTLLNADFKLMPQIVLSRLRPWLIELLQPSQHCGVQGNTVLKTTAVVKEAAAYAETTNNALCILSLDFKEAFDNISHSYLFTILNIYGFSEGFQQRIKSMYEGATLSVQMNGHTSSPITIRCSIKPGCPLSMQLFAMWLNHLLYILDEKLTGIQIRRRSTKTAVVV
jgi:hypothetical protein